MIAEGTVDVRRTIRPGVRCELRVRELPAGLADTLRAIPGVIAVAMAGDEHPVLQLALEGDGPVLAAVLRETVEAGGEIHGCDVAP